MPPNAHLHIISFMSVYFLLPQYLHVVSSKENSFYKDGTHLTSNGMYGKYAYLADGGERHLTLPSLYVMLWLNFATFGMAEVSAKSKIRFVCKDPQDTLKICSERLERLWTYMTVNLNFCDEHVTCLITHCLCGIMKVFLSLTPLYYYKCKNHSTDYPLSLWIMKVFLSLIPLYYYIQV